MDPYSGFVDEAPPPPYGYYDQDFVPGYTEVPGYGYRENPYHVQDSWEEEYYPEDFETSDAYYEPEEYISRPWIPYQPPVQPIQAGPTQQITLAYPSAFGYPSSPELTHRFCELHPEECGQRDGDPFSSINDTLNNGTITDADRGASFNHIDIPGVGLAILLILLIFLGLHIGSDGEKKSDKNTSGRPDGANTANPNQPPTNSNPPSTNPSDARRGKGDNPPAGGNPANANPNDPNARTGRPDGGGTATPGQPSTNPSGPRRDKGDNPPGGGAPGNTNSGDPNARTTDKNTGQPVQPPNNSTTNPSSNRRTGRDGDNSNPNNPDGGTTAQTQDTTGRGTRDRDRNTNKTDQAPRDGSNPGSTNPGNPGRDRTNPAGGTVTDPANGANPANATNQDGRTGRDGRPKAAGDKGSGGQQVDPSNQPGRQTTDTTQQGRPVQPPSTANTTNPTNPTNVGGGNTTDGRDRSTRDRTKGDQQPNPASSNTNQPGRQTTDTTQQGRPVQPGNSANTTNPNNPTNVGGGTTADGRDRSTRDRTKGDQQPNPANATTEQPGQQTTNTTAQPGRTNPNQPGIGMTKEEQDAKKAKDEEDARKRATEREARKRKHNGEPPETEEQKAVREEREQKQRERDAAEAQRRQAAGQPPETRDDRARRRQQEDEEDKRLKQEAEARKRGQNPSGGAAPVQPPSGQPGDRRTRGQEDDSNNNGHPPQNPEGQAPSDQDGRNTSRRGQNTDGQPPSNQSRQPGGQPGGSTQVQASEIKDDDDEAERRRIAGLGPEASDDKKRRRQEKLEREKRDREQKEAEEAARRAGNGEPPESAADKARRERRENREREMDEEDRSNKRIEEAGRRARNGLPPENPVEMAEREAYDQSLRDEARRSGRDPYGRSGRPLGSRGGGLAPQGLLILLLLIPILAIVGRGTMGHLPRVKHSSGIPTRSATVFGATSQPTSAAPKWVLPVNPVTPPQRDTSNINVNNNEIHINSPPVAAAAAVADSPPVIIESSTEKPPVVVKAAHQPLPALTWRMPDIAILGPTDPERFINMLLAASIVCLPLIFDWAREFPVLVGSPPNYLSPLIHYLILGLLASWLLYKFDEEYGWWIGYGIPSVVYVNNVWNNMAGGGTVVVDGSVAEELLFGDGRTLLGAALAGLGVLLLSQRSPPMAVPKPRYLGTEFQFLYSIGVLALCTIFWKASE